MTEPETVTVARLEAILDHVQKEYEPDTPAEVLFAQVRKQLGLDRPREKLAAGWEWQRDGGRWWAATHGGVRVTVQSQRLIALGFSSEIIVPVTTLHGVLRHFGELP